MRKANPSITIWLLSGLVLLNLGLKLAWTGVNELSGDEPFTVYWSLRPYRELFGMLRTENNPPLYFLLMHEWQQMVPLDPVWLRVPSAIFSALTVWPLFLLGRRLGGLRAGVTAALLFTFSQHSYAFAHEVRAYSLLVLACTWAMWQLVRLADDRQRHPSRRPATIAWLLAANVLATWAHYFGWLVVGLELVLVFTVPLLRPVRPKMLATVLLTVLLSLPLAATLRDQAGTSLSRGTWLEVPSVEEPYNMVMRWSNAPVVAVLFILLLAFVLVRRRGRTAGLAIPLLWTFLPLVGMFLISLRFPIYLDRYLLFASPGFYLLVGLAVTSLPVGGWMARAAALGCIVAMAVTFAPWKDTGLHPSRVVAQTAAWQEGATTVLIQPGWYGLTYAWATDPELFKSAAPLDITLRESGIWTLPSNQFATLDSSWSTVIHIDAWALLTDPEGEVLRTLRSTGVQVDSVEADKKVWVRRFRPH